MNHYNQDADDFYVNIHLNTEMELPTNRDTVLHFFEQIKKGFPDLRNFHTRENGDLVLEGDKEADSYRWVSIEQRRLCSGHTNPESLDDAYRQHEMVLDMAPPLLTISLLDFIVSGRREAAPYLLNVLKKTGQPPRTMALEARLRARKAYSNCIDKWASDNGVVWRSAA